MTPQPQSPALLESGIYDIVEPALFPWVPPPMAWYLLGLLLLLLCFVYAARRHLHSRDQRRVIPQAMLELSLLSNESSNLPEAIFQILLKVVSITGIQNVAALTADELEALPIRPHDGRPTQANTTSGAPSAIGASAPELPGYLQPTIAILVTLQRHRYHVTPLNEAQQRALLPQAFDALRAIPSKGSVRL